MAVLIGGEKAYLQRVIGDIVVSYQWVNDEPAMILWPKIKRLGTKGAFVLGLSSAYLYADMRYLVQKSAQAAEFIGMDSSKFTINRIATIILEGLEDLIHMPPQPIGMTKAQEQEIGEAKIMVNGETIMETALTVPTELDHE